MVEWAVTMDLVLIVKRTEKRRSSMLLCNGKNAIDDHDNGHDDDDDDDELIVTAGFWDDGDCGRVLGRVARRSCLYLEAWVFDRSCKTVLDAQPQLF